MVSILVYRILPAIALLAGVTAFDVRIAPAQTDKAGSADTSLPGVTDQAPPATDPSQSDEPEFQKQARPVPPLSSEDPPAPRIQSPGTADGPPAGGITVFERMGAELPPLPPEKEFKGVVDEAFGAFQRGFYLTAMDKALARAQLGDPPAQTLVAELMSQGLGVKRDSRGAAFWYGEAAKNGDRAAMFRYAILLMEGKDVARDRQRADALMKKAADAGDPSAQFNHAQVLVADNPGEKGLRLALPYYEKSAAQGVADAQYAIAQLYVSLKDTPPDKAKSAREWLKRAARAGFDTAQLDLGIWLVNGVGGKRDVDAGFQWLRIAAMRGNVVAQNKLSHLYIQAVGTKPDPVEAAKWYVLSRRAGLKDPALEDFYLGLNDTEQKAGIEAANAFKAPRR